MSSWLITWLGDEDLAASKGHPGPGEGPVAEFLRSATFDRVLLLHNHGAAATGYAAWLTLSRRVRAEMVGVELPRPDDFDDVHSRTARVLDEVASRHEAFRDGRRCYLLTPGTKAMSVALLWIGSTTHPGEIHANWSDPAEPDPARRAVRLRWAEAGATAASGSAAAPADPAAAAPASAPSPLDEERGVDNDALRDADGRELSRLPAFREIYDRAALVARSEAPVLIVGESGTGKELLAAWVHRLSARGGRPFLPVKCGAVPPTLIDSHLFGHVRGAFSGATTDSPGLVGTAAGGTLFLDEVDALPRETQARLWRVLQAGEVYRAGSTKPERVDVRIVAASARDLRRLVRQEDFRPDLYFRLAQYTLRLPPLRERLEDLPLLCDALLTRWRERYGADASLDPGAWRALRAYPWPGNVRELQGILTRCLVDAPVGPDGARVIDRALVARALEEQGLGTDAPPPAGGDDWVGAVVERLLASGKPYGEAMFAVEATVISRLLGATKSQAEAARRLGMTPQGLNAKLKTLRRHGAAL